jgi:hypothetical protein
MKNILAMTAIPVQRNNFHRRGMLSFPNWSDLEFRTEQINILCSPSGPAEPVKTHYTEKHAQELLEIPATKWLNSEQFVYSDAIKKIP